MSHREIKRATDSLDAVVHDLFKLSPEDSDRFIEAIQDLARQLADDEIDRLFNRGDYRN